VSNSFQIDLVLLCTTSVSVKVGSLLKWCRSATGQDGLLTWSYASVVNHFFRRSSVHKNSYREFVDSPSYLAGRKLRYPPRPFLVRLRWLLISVAQKAGQ